jgi:glycosyltransferase involved in cell wall biosynthesis
VYLAQACRLVEWLQKAGAVHLHAHFGTNPAEVAMLARALGGPPYSFTVHGPEEFDKPLALGLARKARDAAFVVAISSYGRSQLYRWLAAEDWPRVEVIPCGLEPGFAIDADAPSSQRVPAPRFVCVGRLCEQKGQLLLVEAVALLHKRGVSLDLVLAGDGEMRAEIQASIARHELGSHVTITGWIASADVRREVLAARALVLASFAEGLPVVIMEAMALARPVVSTWVAGIPELVVDGETGWLVPAGDVEALASALEKCLAADGEVLLRMGRAGQARVLDRHDVDRSARMLATAFALSAST